ncbi:MAG: signal peptide peptidase SppA [Saprospiraceae bacterium]|nr:signal peptide peptidase SppA [Saprospiraceae bacterium]
MKEFFRSMLGSCLGVFVAMLIVVILIFGAGAAMSISGKGVKSAEKGVLNLTLNHDIPEKSDNMETGFMNPPESSLGLRHMVRLIEQAAKDPNIKGVVIQANSLQMGQATLLQLREALKSFKTSDKFIYAYADSYSQSAYYLASVADSIFLNPNGDVGLQGYGVVSPFFKGMLDKVGVNFEVFYAGDFKSATEPLRRTDMSAENRIQIKAFLNDMMGLMKREVAASRKLPLFELDRIMTELDGRSASRALQNKLVDENLYWDQFESRIRKAAGLETNAKINYLSINDYDKMAELSDKGKYSQKVAVVYAEGDVVYNNPSKGVIDNIKYQKIFDKIRRDDNIKAVVLRVNSGGGSALTSDILWREIELIKAKGIPVIASFGDYAASGGYYIAAGADSIFAAPNTLTGSIGVFSMLPNVRKLATDKLGITFDTVKTHNLAVNLSTVYPLSDAERRYMTESTDDIYKQFLQRVADGRGMPVDSVHKYAQGRVWTGKKAATIGLVDEIGFLQDAISAAAKKAGIAADYKVVEYPKIAKTFWEEILESWAKQQAEEGEESMKLNSETRYLYDMYQKYKVVLQNEGVQARMLLDVRFD